jgi:hypothetical protein
MPAANVRADIRTIDNYVDDTLALLTLHSTSKLHANSMTGWVYKISEDITSRQNRPNNRIGRHEPSWTVKAAQQHSTNLTSGAKEFQDLHLEHPVPRGKIVHWLCDLPKPTRLDVVRAIELFSLTCWVTGASGTPSYKGSEAEFLNNGKYHHCKLNIKESMPPNWCFLHGDPWDRYRYVRSQSEGGLSDLKAPALDLKVPSQLTCDCSPNSANRVR